MRRDVKLDLGDGWLLEAAVETSSDGYAVREIRIAGGEGSLPFRKLRSFRWADVVGGFVPDAETFLPPAPSGVRGEVRLALMARDYVALVKRGYRHPNKVLGERWGLTPRQVASDIHRARRRYGLLAPDEIPQGAAKGWLTDRAREVLRGLDE